MVAERATYATRAGQSDRLERVRHGDPVVRAAKRHRALHGRDGVRTEREHQHVVGDSCALLRDHLVSGGVDAVNDIARQPEATVARDPGELDTGRRGAQKRRAGGERPVGEVALRREHLNVEHDPVPAIAAPAPSRGRRRRCRRRGPSLSGSPPCTSTYARTRCAGCGRATSAPADNPADSWRDAATQLVGSDHGEGPSARQAIHAGRGEAAPAARSRTITRRPARPRAHPREPLGRRRRAHRSPVRGDRRSQPSAHRPRALRHARHGRGHTRGHR